MSDESPIFFIETNAFARRQVATVLARYDLEERVQIEEKVPEAADSTVIVLNAPYRPGAVIDRVLSVLDRKPEDLLDIGGGRILDRYLSLYYSRQDAPSIRLTEKETALLLLLAETDGAAVSRQTLLDDVWQYAESAETHTLETHIYRLRQKIETDPANPQILKTNDAGYYLSVE